MTPEDPTHPQSPVPQSSSPAQRLLSWVVSEQVWLQKAYAQRLPPQEKVVHGRSVVPTWRGLDGVGERGRDLLLRLMWFGVSEGSNYKPLGISIPYLGPTLPCLVF